ncbi:transcription factor Jra [Musca vetustissima]|uniref:transcription factor Jra n=1 Tax=Musca vetustissima TaxID=27455 RepID=UPI002AB74897|nr:transcription factor Jra [Musca vetustissima]
MKNSSSSNDISPNVLIKSEPSNGINNSENIFSSPNSANGIPTGNVSKRPASLDLKNTNKKRIITPSPLVIESPSENHQKPPPLTTPDLDKLLHFLPTPQPGSIFQTKTGAVTSEQEAFGKGFEEALHSLHSSNNKQIQVSRTNCGSDSIPTSLNSVTTNANIGTGMSGGSFTYTELDSFNSIPIKDEPQHASTSPPVSPIDMETQEKIKLERKRQRNRVAASKCRKRKLERISKLEEKVKMLKGENSDLASIVKSLKEHVAQLKQQVIEHIESGCSIQTMCTNGTILLQNK